MTRIAAAPPVAAASPSGLQVAGMTAPVPPSTMDGMIDTSADLRAQLERNVGPVVLWLARQSWAARWITP